MVYCHTLTCMVNTRAWLRVNTSSASAKELSIFSLKLQAGLDCIPVPNLSAQAGNLSP